MLQDVLSSDSSIIGERSDWPKINSTVTASPCHFSGTIFQAKQVSLVMHNIVEYLSLQCIAALKVSQIGDNHHVSIESREWLGFLDLKAIK